MTLRPGRSDQTGSPPCPLFGRFFLGRSCLRSIEEITPCRVRTSCPDSVPRLSMARKLLTTVGRLSGAVKKPASSSASSRCSNSFSSSPLVAGSATVYWLSAPNQQTIGASGAIFGLMAALVVVAVKVRGDVSSLLTLVGINVVITVLGSSFISWQGHLGGFVGGLVIGAILVYAPRERRTAWQVAGLSLVGIAILAAVVARSLALG